MAGRAQGAALARWPLPLLLAAGRARLAAALPLEKCSSKVNITTPMCARTDVAACWTSVEEVDWYCLAVIGLEDDAEDLDQDCRGRPPLEPSQQVRLQAPSPQHRFGRTPGYYEGACLLPPRDEGEGDSEAPLTFEYPEVTERILEEPPVTEGEPDFTADTSSDAPAPLSWDAAYKKARATLARMNATEKNSLLQGIGYDRQAWWEVKKWYYVGNSPAMPHLGIPSLNMQDGGGGFHSKYAEARGTVTCWPSLLSLAATWDPGLSRRYAAALGEEFAGKGANGILGPSVDVHRVARNGRNFEYLSGEDPYLGSRMAEEYVAGVQSKGVFAVVKHWIFNTQENDREISSSVVDERSAHELYYPPFEAAVRAGASAVMCSYNKINGTYSCENEETLNGVLRGQMGFRGFVQSDWWAAHSLSVPQGLDQEMPGEGINVYFRNRSIANASMPNHVDTAVLRILAVIYRMRLPETTKCTPPHCSKLHVANVSTPAHVALAEYIATESIVMLKNEVGTLPFRPPLSGGPRTIAVIGSAAIARPFDPENAGQGQGDWATGDYYSGGGSGHVVAGRVVTPLEGIRRRAEAAGVTVYASPTNNVQEAVLVSQSADVLVVVAATTSGESRDRTSLHLDNQADELITTLSLVHSSKRIIVLMQVPGAVVMPWRDNVDCILAMFLGGQETGGAWAAVLFGDRSPSGRLPLTLPEAEGEEVQPAPQGEDAVFSEALATGYRSTKLKVAFPFGHGLSYSTFSYGDLSEEPCEDREAILCLHVVVSNSGTALASTVAQLYLGFPPEAGYPRDVLRGFAKTPRLRPGESEAVVFTLTGRDISYYSVGRGWLTPQYIIARVGESSVDLRQTLKVESVPRVPTSAPTQAPTLAPTSAPTVTTLTTSATTTSATTTTSTSTTRAPGWYGSLVGHGCDEECSSLGLSCTEEGLWSNRADVNTSKKVLALVAALGGNTSAVACADETDESYAGTSSPSWGPHSCSRVRQDRELGTFDCSAPPRRGEARLCYCGDAAPFRITLGDVGRVARETWNRSHIGEQLGSWEQQLGSWGHDHGLDSVIRPVMDLQPASRDTEATEKRELSRSVRSGWSGRSVGLFLASAGLAAATLFVLSTRCACHRHQSGSRSEEEFVQMELVADDARDTPDGPPDGADGGDAAAPPTEPSRSLFVTGPS